MGLDNNTSRSSNRVYNTGAVSDKCKEKLDNNTKSNAHYSCVEDKHKTNNQQKNAAAEEEESRTRQDEIAQGSNTNFERFSNN